LGGLAPRDEGLAYAERLRDDDLEVTAHHYEDMMHVFFQLAIVFDRGNEAVQQVGRDIRAVVTTEPVCCRARPEGRTLRWHAQ
jgi:acetyl esterase/lipase